MTIAIDTSAIYALLVETDDDHGVAAQFWAASAADDFVAHSYVIVESIALLRSRWGWRGVDALADRILPAIAMHTVDRELHDAALAEYRRERGGASFVDHVTIAFARRDGIREVFAFDRDLEAAGLRFAQRRQEGPR